MVIDSGALLSFVAAVLVIQLVPGPGMLFVLANGIVGGAGAGMVAACGAATGMLIHTVLAAAGLAALLASAPRAYEVVRMIGAAYLLWLALIHLRSSARPPITADAHARAPMRSVFLRGLLNNLANPKIIVFFIAFLPQFIVAEGSTNVQFVVLGIAFLLVGLALDLSIGAASGRLGALLRRHHELPKVLDRAAALIYTVLGVRLLVENN